MMVDKGIDVNELVNSNLMYPEIWQNKPMFSDIKELTIQAYNNSIEDLEHELPEKVFTKKQKRSVCKCLCTFGMSCCFKRRQKNEPSLDVTNQTSEDKNLKQSSMAQSVY